MTIYIIGSGGVGGYVGALLAHAGHNVTFLARGAHFEAIKQNGFAVKTVHGEFLIKPAQVISSPSEIEDPDIIIFSVKTYDTAEVAAQMAQKLTDKTMIITFQNGVENDLRIREHIGHGQVLPAIAYIISTRTAPGVISQTGGLRKFIFGNRDDWDNPAFANLEQIFQAAGLNVTYSQDIEKELWKKFIFIIGFAGVTALYQEPIGKITADPEKLAACEALIREAHSVGTAAGVKFDDNALEVAMSTVLKTAPDSKSSLLHDLENGRPTEIETLHGTVIRLAKEHGVEVPMSERVYEVVKKYEESRK